MPDVIRLTNVQKSFGPKHVLRGVDLSVEKGSSLVVIGGSGSGKSVMLKCILGLMTPEQGAIGINGMQTVGLRGGKREAVNRQFGMLFQNGALFDSLPVWQNVSFAAMQGNNMPADEARELAKENLALVGLDENSLDLFPASLSGGMHKRVGLARAIATRPPIMFFDEPTTGLDPIMTDAINHLIRDCADELGATTMTITHDMSSVRTIGDRAALLYQGKITWSGSIDELENSDDPFLVQFINGLADGPMEAAGG